MSYGSIIHDPDKCIHALYQYSLLTSPKPISVRYAGWFIRTAGKSSLHFDNVTKNITFFGKIFEGL